MKTSSAQFLVLETLEDRLVLSGLSDGTPVLKQLTYFDADGDKVTIKVTGKTSPSAGFQVSGAENGADLEEINLVGLGPKNNLVVTVTPTRLAPSDLTTANALFSPGYTNIGTITADSQSDNLNRPLDGATALRNLRLNAAVVSHIDLPEVDIFGSLSLNTGRTAFVDRINTAAVELSGVGTSYNPSAGLIDLHDVTAKSLGGIQVSGVVAALANNTSGLPGESPTNDLNGAITITGNLGGITARQSVLNGDVTVGGNLGLSSFGNLAGTVDVAGNLTAQLPANGTGGLLAAGGHLNLGWQPGASGTGLSGVDIFAGAGISGLRASTTDPILVPSAYDGILTNTSTSSDTGTGIANVRIIGGEAAFKIVSSNSVGDLRALKFGTGMNVEAGTGGIGSIAAGAGQLDGTYRSAGNIGALSATGGAIGGNFESVGNIGQITVSTPNTDGITGQFTAGGSIAGVQVTIATLGGGEAIAAGARIEAGTSLGPVVINSLAKDRVAVAGSLLAGSGITSVNITAASTAAAISGTVSADHDGNGSGNLPVMTATNNGTGAAAAGATVKGATIGAVTFNARNADSNATSGVTVEANNNISSIQATGNLTGVTRFVTTASGSSIGTITGTGSGSQAIQVATGSSGSVGAVTFASLGSDSSLDYNVGANVVSLGAITARGSSSSSVVLTGALTDLNSLAGVRADGSADLSNLQSGIFSLGAINVGTLVLPSNLSNVSSLSSLSASQVNTIAPVTFGSRFGNNAGPISIGNPFTGGSGSQVTFAFGGYAQTPLINGSFLGSGATIGNFTRS